MPGARRLDQPLPDDLEVLREVRDARAGAIGVRPGHDRAETTQCLDHLVGDPADHLSGGRAGRVEAVERVQDRGRGAAEERQGVDQQRPGAAARRRDRGRGAGGPGADHDDVERAVDVGQLARPRTTSGEPAGSPDSIQRPIESREKSWSTTIEDAPITPARPPRDERWISRSRVASGSERR